MNERFCQRCDGPLGPDDDYCPECGVSAEPGGTLGELAIHERLRRGREAMAAAHAATMAHVDSVIAAMAAGDAVAAEAAYSAARAAAESAAAHGSPKVTREVEAALLRARHALDG